MLPIGFIQTEFSTLENMPVQPGGADNAVGRITINPEYQDGLIDLDGFSHIHLIYEFHLSDGYNLIVRPFLDDREHGVFATRAPRRPNPIGMSIVRLLSVRHNLIEVSGADLVNGTPILDIKPYMKQFDKIEDSSSGWLAVSDEEIRKKKSDQRFK